MKECTWNSSSTLFKEFSFLQKGEKALFGKKIRLNALHGEAQPHDRFTRSAAPVNSHPKEKLDEAANSQKTA